MSKTGVKMLTILLVFFLASLVMAQQEATTPTKEKVENVKAEEVGVYVPPSEIEPAELGRRVPLVLSGGVFDRTVTLDFKDAELQNVLRAIARQHNLNLLMHPRIVKGKVTVHLENVKLGVALDSILKTNDLAAVLEPGEIIRIVPRSQVQVTKIEVKTIHVPINWVTAGEMLKTLKPFLTEKAGQIKEHRDTNSLIITDTPPNLDVIKDLIARLDKPEKQVLIEARLVDISLKALRDLGINWGLSKNEVTGPVGNDLVTLDKFIPPGGFGITVEKVAQFLGQDWDLDMTLSALEREDKATVLAQPRVVTLNNVPANIEIIEKIPYFEAIESAGGGGQIRFKVEFEEAGIKLQVTPNITNNNYVRMKLEPEQKVVVAWVAGFQGDVPQIDERKALTNVTVEDEETVCLGGLRQLRRSKSQSGTPWLMNVPVFGWLFKDKTYEDQRTELVFFVTPHVLKAPELTAKEIKQYNLIDAHWEKRDTFYDDVEIIIPKDEVGQVKAEK